MTGVNPGGRVSKVVILGGGTAGWMTAAALSKILGGGGVAIELVESDEIGIVGVGEATIPQLLHFNALLEIDEDAFVRATEATYKLGIEFVDWMAVGERYFHPFGSYGLPMLGVDFQHFWLKGRLLGDAMPLDAYSLAAVAAREGRFVRPIPAQTRSPLSRLSYAFQFDASLYARFLRSIAEPQGVLRTEGMVVDVVRDGESGLVQALRLADGSLVEGDLFIDCSGFRGRLIEQEMASGYEDWSDWLPCDRAVAVPSARIEEPIPYTRATARAAGWQWRIPLQHRTGNGYVYSSCFLSDDEAIATLLGNLDSEPLADPRPLRFVSGYRRRPWIGNVVSIGLASGFLEPLESTSIHLVQSAIARLMALFPTRAFDAAEIEAYNRQTIQDYETIRDFLVLHYKATRRDDTPFWRHCQNLPVPEGLRRKLDLFGANGRIVRENDELFTETSWFAVLAGQGVQPRGYHPVLDLLSREATLDRLSDVREVNRRVASIMPRHADFLAGHRELLTPP
ncbi:MAG: tryptophan halogenase family protein [Sphingomonas sp.]|jgi:tryptophan halogenase|uniref:tryptophan halogenase family protein n=1 Tax=Sphingomonas sp. TaxID=28214 RepID=UPI00356A5992